jgi:hypothetical protein
MKTFFSIILAVTVLSASCKKDSPTGSSGNSPSPTGGGKWGSPTYLGSAFLDCYSPSISGDGNTLYFDHYVDSTTGIFYSVKTSTGWSAFTRIADGRDPWISYDGNTLYFDKSSSIWKMTKSGGNWSSPDSLFRGPTFGHFGAPTITQDGGTMYFSWFSGSIQLSKIFSAHLESGTWVQNGEVSALNVIDAFDPAISSDGSQIYFATNSVSSPLHYAIAFSKKENGVWQTPSILDSTINFAIENSGPCLSWDKSKLYFSIHDVYRHQYPSGIYVSSWIPN